MIDPMALYVHRAQCYIRELVAWHRTRGAGLHPELEQTCRKADAFVDRGANIHSTKSEREIVAALAEQICRMFDDAGVSQVERHCVLAAVKAYMPLTLASVRADAE